MEPCSWWTSMSMDACFFYPKLWLQFCNLWLVCSLRSTGNRHHLDFFEMKHGEYRCLCCWNTIGLCFQSNGSAFLSLFWQYRSQYGWLACASNFQEFLTFCSLWCSYYCLCQSCKWFEIHDWIDPWSNEFLYESLLVLRYLWSLISHSDSSCLLSFCRTELQYKQHRFVSRFWIVHRSQQWKDPTV